MLFSSLINSLLCSIQYCLVDNISTFHLPIFTEQEFLCFWWPCLSCSIERAICGDGKWRKDPSGSSSASGGTAQTIPSTAAHWESESANENWQFLWNDWLNLMNSWPKTENWHHLLALIRLPKKNIFLAVKLNEHFQSPKMTPNKAQKCSPHNLCYISCLLKSYYSLCEKLRSITFNLTSRILNNWFIIIALWVILLSFICLLNFIFLHCMN